MKQVTREQWTAALRSGEYKQGTGFLYNEKDDTYCCLGVLGALAGGERSPEHSGGMKFDVQTPSDCYLPKNLTDMVGVTEEQFRLVAMNDSGDNTFSGIADYIDRLPAPEKI
jgi:hypothetical protein